MTDDQHGHDQPMMDRETSTAILRAAGIDLEALDARLAEMREAEAILAIAAEWFDLIGTGGEYDLIKVGHAAAAENLIRLAQRKVDDLDEDPDLWAGYRAVLERTELLPVVHRDERLCGCQRCREQHERERRRERAAEDDRLFAASLERRREEKRAESNLFVRRDLRRRARGGG